MNLASRGMGRWLTRTPTLGPALGILLVVLAVSGGRSFAAAPEPPNGNSSLNEWVGSRWTGGIVPYVVEDSDAVSRPGDCAPLTNDPSKHLIARQVTGILEAIDQIEALTPVQFNPVPQPLESGAYLYYLPTSGSSNAVYRGMPATNWPNTVEANCVYQKDAKGDDLEQRRAALHETVHALGVAHEQQRRDGYTPFLGRPPFLVYDGQCLKGADPDDPTPEPSGKLDGTEDYTLVITPYDASSVMQYSSDNSCDKTLDGCSADDPTDPNCTDADDTTPCKQVCAHPIRLRNIECTTTATCFCSDPPVLGDCRWIDVPAELSYEDVNALNRMYEKPFGQPNPDDALGSAFAVGDFDGDGYDDLAVGAPGDGDGAVYVWKGTGGAFRGTLGRPVVWRALKPPANTVAGFGRALAAGDFDGDGRTDLAVGAPGEGPDGTYPGTVFIYSPTEATPTTPRLTLKRSVVRVITQDSQGLGPGTGGDRFGHALAVGDFDDDGKEDLAIGAPHERVATGARAGEVFVVTGARPHRAVAVTASQFSGVTSVDGMRFGAALSIARLNPDGAPDTEHLVVGSPENGNKTGLAYVFAGLVPSRSGDVTALGPLSFEPKQILRPKGGKGSDFGADIAINDFDGARTTEGHSRREIAIGAPDTAVTTTDGKGRKKTVSKAGAVFLFAPESDGGINYTEVLRVEEPTPKAGDRFGGVLMGYRVASGGGDATGITRALLFAGLPEKNRVDTFFWTALDAAHQSYSPLDPGIFTHQDGERFGAALAQGNFRPVASSDETVPENAEGSGRSELVVGTPGIGQGSGAFWTDNFDQDDPAFQWIILTKATILHE